MSHSSLLLQCLVCLEMHPKIAPGHPCCLHYHKPSPVVRVCSPPCTIPGLHSWNSTNHEKLILQESDTLWSLGSPHTALLLVEGSHPLFLGKGAC